MIKGFKRAVSLITVFALILTTLGAVTAFADEDDGSVAEPVTAGYTTYAWETFDKPVVKDGKEDVYSISFADGTYFKGAYRNGDGLAVRMDGTYLDAVKVTSDKDVATYSKMDIVLANSGINFADALANNLYVETEFDMYYSSLPNDNSTVMFASGIKSTSDPAVTLVNKKNGEFKIDQIQKTYKSNYAAAQSNQNLPDTWKRFKFVMHAGSGVNASGETVDGWILDGVYMDGQDTIGAAKYKRGAVLSTNNYTDFLLNYKITKDQGFVAVDNVSVTAYTKAQLDANGGVSPVPNRMKYLNEVLSYKATVDSYNTTAMRTAYDNAINGFYKEGLMQSDLDALKKAIDDVAANYKKLEQYKEMLDGIEGADEALSAAKTAIDNGDEAAMNEAFNALNALLSKLPQTVANYTFDTSADTRAASIYTDRYTFDDTTFAGNMAYGGTFTYKGDKSGFKFTPVKFAELPANTYVRTSFDIKYNANDYNELALYMRDGSGNTINRFAFTKAGTIYSKSSEKNKFSLNNMTPDEMHRVTFTFKATDADGSVNPTMVDMSVDGVCTTGFEHPLNPKTFGETYTTPMEAYGQIYFAPANQLNGSDSVYSEYWLDNLSVVTYQSVDGTTSIADKTELIKGLTIISSLYNNAQTSEETKALIDAKKDSFVQVLNDAVAKTEEVAKTVKEQNAIIADVVKAEFEKSITDSFDFSNITSDINVMASSYTSPAISAYFDINWDTNNRSVISANGEVSRPKINKNVEISYTASSNTTGVTFSGKFDAKVMASGESVSLPASGQLVAYKDAADSAAVSINGTDIAPVSFAGKKEISVAVDTAAGRYAVYADGEYLAGSTISANEISSVKINGEDAAVIKDSDENYYEVTGFKYKMGSSEYSKPIAGTTLTSVSLKDRNMTRDNAVAVVAAYTNGGTVLFDKAYAQVGEYDLDRDVTIPVTLNLPDDRSDVTIKAYVFSSLETLAPVANIYSYKSEITSNATIYIAGDSTACKYDGTSFPQTGWGQVLSEYCLDGIKVDNRARGGATVKTFYERSDLTSFKSISEDIIPGDYLIIQFGHNESRLGTDRTLTDEEYAEYIRKYIEMAQEKGALPILATSITKRSDLSDNDSIERLRVVARNLAQEYGIPCIDMSVYTKKLCNEIGKETSKFLYMFTDLDDPRYTEEEMAESKFNNPETYIVDGNYQSWVDDTHLNIYGARIYAMYAAEQLKGIDSTLDAYIDGSKILSYKDIVNKINADYQEYLKLL